MSDLQLERMALGELPEDELNQARLCELKDSNREILDDWLERVTIDPGHETKIAPASLPEQDRLTHAALFNTMGLYHYDRERFPEAAEYLETAFSFQNSSATIFENMMSALTFSLLTNEICL